MTSAKSSIDKNQFICFIGILFFLSTIPIALSNLQRIAHKTNENFMTPEEFKCKTWTSFGSNCTNILDQGAALESSVFLKQSSPMSGTYPDDNIRLTNSNYSPRAEAPCSDYKCAQYGGRNILFMIIMYTTVALFAYVAFEDAELLNFSCDRTNVESLGLYSFFYPLSLTFVFFIIVLLSWNCSYSTIRIYYWCYLSLLLIGLIVFLILYFTFTNETPEDEITCGEGQTYNNLTKKCEILPSLHMQKEIVTPPPVKPSKSTSVLKTISKPSTTTPINANHNIILPSVKKANPPTTSPTTHESFKLFNKSSRNTTTSFSESF